MSEETKKKCTCDCHEGKEFMIPFLEPVLLTANPRRIAMLTGVTQGIGSGGSTVILPIVLGS